MWNAGGQWQGHAVIAGDVTVGGVIALSAGSFAAPSLTFSAEPNMGFYRSAAGQMAFTSNNPYFIFGGNLLRMASGTVFGWASTADANGAAADGYFKRKSATTVGVNVGGAADTSTASVGGVLSINTTSTPSTQTAKQTLLSYALPASALSADGKGVRITAWGTAKATANAKTQTIDFGATTVASTGAVANNGGNWTVVAEVWRTGAATQVARGSAVSATTPAVTNSTPAETATGAITIALTSTNVTDVDGTTAKGLLVEFLN